MAKHLYCFIHLPCLLHVSKLYRGPLGMCRQSPHRKPWELNRGLCHSATVLGVRILSKRSEHVHGEAFDVFGNLFPLVRKQWNSWHFF